MRDAPSTRDLILDAAEQAILERGMANLTLELVAQEAGLTKGGLFYHFPSKDALIDAVVARFVARFDAALAAHALADAEEGGRITRAFLRASLNEQASEGRYFEQVGAVLLAALYANGGQIDRLKDMNRRWQARMEDDGIDPVTATIVRLAVDGLWLAEAYDLYPLDPALRAEVVARLEALTRAPAEGPATPSPPATAGGGG